MSLTGFLTYTFLSTEKEGGGKFEVASCRHLAVILGKAWLWNKGTKVFRDLLPDNLLLQEIAFFPSKAEKFNVKEHQCLDWVSMGETDSNRFQLRDLRWGRADTKDRSRPDRVKKQAQKRVKRGTALSGLSPTAGHHWPSCHQKAQPLPNWNGHEMLWH